MRPTDTPRGSPSHLDPSTHLESYIDGAAITFELGQQDLHVPARNAAQFRDRLREVAPATADRVRLQSYANLNHLGVTTSEKALTAAFAWLTESNP